MNKHILTKSQTNQPVLVQLSNKTGKPTTSEYWDTYFNGLNLLHDPRVITGGILGAEIIDGYYGGSSPDYKNIGSWGMAIDTFLNNEIP